MAADYSPSRAALRAFVVVTLALLVLAANALELRRIWNPTGEFGYATNGDNVVTYVAQGSPAARAGIHNGDIIDVPSTAPQYQHAASTGRVLNAGQSATFNILHDGVRRTVTLTAIPESRGPLLPFTLWRIADLGIVVLFVTLGAMLVLLRPSLTTWGFFIYCLGGGPLAIGVFDLLGVAEDILSTLLITAGYLGLVVFALCFLNEPVHGWRRTALGVIPWFFAVWVAGVSFAYYWSFKVGGPPGELLLRLFFVEVAVASLFAMYALVATYVRAVGDDRQRIRWIVVGFGVYLVTWFLVILGSNYSYGLSHWIARFFALITIIVPLTVAYAVIKHRVIDVSFVVNRALVYGILTTLLVGIFSLIDWLFMQKLGLERLGTIVSLGVAVAGGFWFNSLHRRIDAFVDATFFRKRYAAERQLAKDAAALPFSPTADAVAHFLVNEPVKALSLASGALFARDHNGTFTRSESQGWSSFDLAALDSKDDPILMLAHAEGGPLHLFDHAWRTDGLPAGAARPALALPIVVRRELVAIALYGSHVHGEALDPDEIEAIASLASGAAAAYDHLEAEAMRRENEAMRTKVELMERLLAEAQIQSR